MRARRENEWQAKRKRKAEKKGKESQRKRKDADMKGELLTYERMIDIQVLNVPSHFSNTPSIFNLVWHY
jgi:hypothetical protein